ncbi:MAG: trypsin-like serine protease, partial [Myxococcales bacterium]|nr:trypsin-like serine protease [Myxococcales bacterium]
MNLHARALFALTLITTFSAACNTDQVGQPVLTRTQEIVNGTRDPQAIALTSGQIEAIGYLYYGGDPSQTFCTGTLISDRVVITAEHCTSGNAADEIGFGFGQEPDEPTGFYAVERIYAHPEVDAATLVLAESPLDDLDITPIPF